MDDSSTLRDRWNYYGLSDSHHEFVLFSTTLVRTGGIDSSGSLRFFRSFPNNASERGSHFDEWDEFHPSEAYEDYEDSDYL